MHQRKLIKKKAPASANWSRALKRKGPTHKVKPLTRQLLHMPNGSASHKLFTTNGNGSLRHATAQLSLTMERRKTKEEWLRKEIRDNRSTMTELLKWGVAVLTGVETMLYFVRRDVANHLASIGTLPAYGTVPAGRWFIGTAFLTMIALFFCQMTNYVMKRHIKHREQLLNMKPTYSGIIEEVGGGRIRQLHYYLLLAFPAFDLILWCYFRITGSITINM